MQKLLKNSQMVSISERSMQRLSPVPSTRISHNWIWLFSVNLRNSFYICFNLTIFFSLSERSMLRLSPVPSTLISHNWHGQMSLERKVDLVLLTFPFWLISPTRSPKTTGSTWRTTVTVLEDFSSLMIKVRDHPYITYVCIGGGGGGSVGVTGQKDLQRLRGLHGEQ